MRLFFIPLLILISIKCFGDNSEKLIVYFEFDKYNLTKISQNAIDEKLQKSEYERILIKAYCDSFGNIEYNMSLSSRRANAIRNFLIDRNINESKIRIEYFGEKFPLNNNEDETARALNRRGEILNIQKIKLQLFKMILYS